MNDAKILIINVFLFIADWIITLIKWLLSTAFI